MGMFDYVNFETKCPTCGHNIGGFQSKDLGCDMETVEPDAVTDFYSSCGKCGTWVEFYRERSDVPARQIMLNEDQILALGFKKEIREKVKP